MATRDWLFGRITILKSTEYVKIYLSERNRDNTLRTRKCEGMESKCKLRVTEHTSLGSVLQVMFYENQEKITTYRNAKRGILMGIT